MSFFNLGINASFLKPFIRMYTVLDGEGNGNPLQYFCLENPMDRGAWQATIYGDTKSRTRLSEFSFTFHFHALEKAVATHSSVLAWRIPGIGEPGGLPSIQGRAESDRTEAAQQQQHTVLESKVLKSLVMGKDLMIIELHENIFHLK